MSADTIRVDYDELNRIMAIFEDHMEQTRILLQRLETRAGELDWEGDNAVVFFGQFSDEVQPAIIRLIQAYDRASGTTREIIRVMTEAEDQASAIFNGGAVGLVPGGITPFGKLGDFLIDGVVGLGITKLSGSLGTILSHKFASMFLKDNLDGLHGQLKFASISSKFTSKIGGGLFGGLTDYGMGVLTGEHAWNDTGALGTELSSGGIQGALVFVPGGKFLVGGDKVIQLGGAGLEVGAQIFEGVTGVDTSGFQDGVKSFTNMMSLDNFVDDLVQGNPEGIVERGSDFLESIGINL
jgi:WXG100 family type VII secretion target